AGVPFAAGAQGAHPRDAPEVTTVRFRFALPLALALLGCGRCAKAPEPAVADAGAEVGATFRCPPALVVNPQVKQKLGEPLVCTHGKPESARTGNVETRVNWATASGPNGLAQLREQVRLNQADASRPVMLDRSFEVNFADGTKLGGN